MAIVNKLRKEPNGTWVYPRSEDVLEEVGLHSIEHYIRVRRETIFNHIINRPIFDLCRQAERRRGSAPCQFWWDQDFNLKTARASANVAVADGLEDST